jgi:23S rRNA pseudouridine2605 synthase
MRVKPAKELRRVGLARALSKLGYCSRSQAALLIREGRVQLNGVPRRDPETPVRLAQDRIEIDRLAVGIAEKVYLKLNKPRGVVTTASDEKGRDTVYAYLGEGSPWVAPVGRLDKASEGLLLLTNDSEWAAKITAPESHLDKTYHVQINVAGNDGLTSAMTHGVRVAGGEFLQAKRAEILRTGTRNSWLEVTLDEGKNRQIRRMLENLDIQVLRLVRVAIGPLELGELAKGVCRPLIANEKHALDTAISAVTFGSARE